MRNFVYLFFVLTLFVFTSCDKADAPVQDSVLELVSDATQQVGSKGGVFAVRYSVTSPIDGVQVEVSTDNTAMISSAEQASDGVVRVTVEPNPSEAERQANVTISCGGDSVSVLFVQAPRESVDMVANQLIGNYYGERLSPGLGHYWIIMSDNGIVDGELVKGAKFFRIDLIAPIADDLESIRVPDGHYRYDGENTLEAYTIPNLGNSDYSYVDDEGVAWAEPLIDATLDVEGSKFTLWATTKERSYNVTFEGDYSIAANIITDKISTLEEDLEIDLTGCSGTLSNHGDYWMCGYNNWSIEFVHNQGLKNGTYLMLDFLSESTTSCVGTYHYSGFSSEDSSKPNFAPGFYIPGMRVSDDGVHMMGSLVQLYENGKGVGQAPLYGGEFTITQNADGTYHLVIDATDDAEPAHKITLDWTGRL